MAISLLTAAATGQLDADRAPGPSLVGREGVTKGAARLVSRPRLNGELVVVRIAPLAGLTFVVARRPVFRHLTAATAAWL